MKRKSLKFYIKEELRTISVDNFVEKKNYKAVFDYKNSVFIRLGGF